MEGEAVARFAFHNDFTVVGVDGFAHQKQFQSDFFPVGAADVKRFKDLLFGAFVEALAVIGNTNECVVAAETEAFGFFQVVFLERNFNGAPAFGQAVPGLDAEFDDGLLHLRGIG